MEDKKNTAIVGQDKVDNKEKGHKIVEPSSPGDEFELTAEMMVNDFDDERTLDEEEALEECDEQQSELSNLEKEKDMPIEALLAMYGYHEEFQPPSPASPRPSVEVIKVDVKSEKVCTETDEPSTKSPTQSQSLADAEDKCNAEVKAEVEPGIDQQEATVPEDIKEKDEASADTSLEIPVEDDAETVKIEADVVTESFKNADPDEEMGVEEESEKDPPSMLHELYKDDPVIGNAGSGTRHLRSGSRQQSEEDEEEEEDIDYSPNPEAVEEDWKKTIMVGTDYQAVIPEEGFQKYDDAMPYENEDKLLWDPHDLTDKEIKDFLIDTEVAQTVVPDGVYKIPKGSHVRDDEQALYLFLQCGLNPEEAIRRQTINSIPSLTSSSLWSEEECRNFESGLRQYGKDFHTIQQHRVRTRTVSELVQFYYLWKKTERHDLFAVKARLEKKKYILHPGTTDFMERFLDEQDSPTTSPNVHSLLSGDPKRHKTPPSPQPVTNNSPSDMSSKREAASNNHIDEGNHILERTLDDSKSDDSVASTVVLSLSPSVVFKNKSTPQGSTASSPTATTTPTINVGESDDTVPSTT